MGVTLDRDEFVARQFNSTRLQKLLQSGLGILERDVQIELFQVAAKPVQNEPACRLNALIQVDRTYDRFNTVRKDGITPVTAALQFSRPSRR